MGPLFLEVGNRNLCNENADMGKFSHLSLCNLLVEAFFCLLVGGGGGRGRENEHSGYLTPAYRWWLHLHQWDSSFIPLDILM